MTTSVEPQRTGWIPDDSTFGARLALVRQRMGWGNVKEAADACGVPVENWRRYERDGRAPRDVLDIAAKIADRTGCEYLWLIGDPRTAAVYRSTGRVTHTVTTGREASAWKPALTEKSARPAYPDRVRPPDGRPSGHPGFPVLPPRVPGSAPVFARPTRRTRPA